MSCLFMFFIPSPVTATQSNSTIQKPIVIFSSLNVSPNKVIAHQPVSNSNAPSLVQFELETQESRQKNRRQSYNHKSKPKRTQYQNHNRHSDGKKGKGGYYHTDSYKGNKGYSDSSTYNRAKKDNYGDGDHKEYGSKNGGSHGGGNSGGSKYGGSRGRASNAHGASGDRFGGGYRGKYASDYSDNGNAYLNAGGGGGY
ncbi:keratin, type I cytoskeletal 9-like [Folsomia candida]|uniref:keratin, type I cytoskeletal 9-like n=1 Tax=Folsomia candida TaxID=158441 RepID=UPI001604FD7C|nr:keratin, type I cytoskeletal 9-like [Folsomia candida]